MKYKLLKAGYPIVLIILTVGILLLSLKPIIVKYFIKQNIQLVPGKFLYNSWLNSSIDLYTEFYLFDLVNAKEFDTAGAKPIFQEIGPFCYKEVRTKEDVVHNLNGTITYKERRQFFFVPERSAFPENRTITSINMAAMVILDFTKYWTKFELEIVNLALRLAGETLLVTQPADKLLFGYEDPFLKILLSLDKNLLPSDKIGLYINKNDTIDGEYTVFTGEQDVEQIGIVDRFNGLNELSVWSSPYANKINGTDGSLNAPFMQHKTLPEVFQSDACRSIHMVYNESLPIFYDINLDGYILDENFLANASINPDNAGFCIPAGNCLVSGVLNLTTCVQIGPANIPAYMSLPHFLFGDESLIQGVEGLKPNFTKHKTIVYFQPLTGIPMKANKRIQLNTKLTRNPNIDLTMKLPEVFFPLFWIDENFSVDKKTSHDFFTKVELPLRVYDFLKYFVLVSGIFLFSLCISITCHLMRENYCGKENLIMYEDLTTDEHNEEPNETTPLVIE